MSVTEKLPGQAGRIEVGGMGGGLSSAAHYGGEGPASAGGSLRDRDRPGFSGQGIY